MASTRAPSELRPQDEELRALLGLIAGVTAAEERIARLTGRLLGRPYVADPLVGSAAEPETLVSRLDGFDCVTFVETVLALAACRAPEEFEPALAALRYEHGRVSYLARNHYMTLWLERNEARGALVRVLPALWIPEGRTRRLEALSDFPPHERRLSYVPIEHLDALARGVKTGDVIGFVSTRSDLDTFHVGLLQAEDRLSLRHASRSAGRIIEEPLEAFLSRNETPGVMVDRLRPSQEER